MQQDRQERRSAKCGARVEPEAPGPVLRVRCRLKKLPVALQRYVEEPLSEPPCILLLQKKEAKSFCGRKADRVCGLGSSPDELPSR